MKVNIKFFSLITSLLVFIVFGSAKPATAGCKWWQVDCHLENVDPTTGDILVSNNTNKWLNIYVFRTEPGLGMMERRVLLAPRERNVLVFDNVATGYYGFNAVEVDRNNTLIRNGWKWDNKFVELGSSGVNFSFN